MSICILMLLLMVSSGVCQGSEDQLSTHLANLVEKLTVMISDYEVRMQRQDEKIKQQEQKCDVEMKQINDKLANLQTWVGCALPEQQKGRRITESSSPGGSIVLTFTCEGRASLQGSPTVECIQGEWNATFPTCYTFKVGDIVKVKSNIETPHFKWGSATKDSIGTITEIKPERLTVNFPEQSGWMAMDSEMLLVKASE